MNVVAAHQGESVVPLLAKGFRPFFLLASVFAATILPVWLLTLFGIVHPGVHFDGVAWHAHEMVFGFAGAVIAGFLLTAVSNWTGRETLTGPGLAGLALLWVAGRVAQLAPVPEALVAVVDLSFLPALAVAVGRPLLLAHNRKNFVMVVALVGLWAADLMVYSPAWRQRGLALGVDLVVLLIVIFSGRVFPMFTRNGTGNSSVRSVPVLDAVAIASTAVVAGVDLTLPGSRAAGLAAAVASALLVARSVHWGARYTTRIPLLWILHAAYAFIPIGFALRAASLWGAAVPPSAATHALTVGAIGCSTLGMMARVALGHTGRMLAVGRPVATAFGLLVIAAVVRTAGPLLPVVYTTSLVVAGTLWALAFGTYAVVYAPIVMGPRIDGKPG
jgi:uncharacterized protein involved in response to NO